MLTLLAGLALAATAAPARGAAPPACAAEISVGFDGENGAFDGMSHSGVLLVLRNTGTAACRLPGLPALSFEDAAGKPLAIARQAPPGMHPGPVVVPVGVAAGAEATAPLRWVSGDVYDGGRCLRPARVTVALGGVASTMAWPAGPLCGPPGKPIPFEQPPVRTDPVLHP